MIGGLSALAQIPVSVLVAIVVVPLGLGVAIGAYVVSWWRDRPTVEDELDEELPDETPDEPGDVAPIEFDPPEISVSPMDWIRAGRHLQKQRKAAKRGWVKWYRVGANFSRPQWVKPVQEGAGTPKVTDGDQPYYFEKDAMVVDERTGAWVAVHPEGEADPINLADRAYPGIETDLVERLLNLEAENDPSSSLLGLGGMSQQQLMWLGVGVLFVLFAAYRYMG
ncbi:hypothetical protein EI982_14605 [Haloplanus rallus]|uniref:Uncharacterized protein n=1 Tax=Haloplanus rallus TaxID=1816183 RepID=A0A6B9F6B0_9EURY|nr:hypothetical protein [Haloplanus rallus]QGX95928.1 hypothetical protein EI982_14605 [Haloplanus rallus]